jgi:hypothetical protein
MYWTQKERREKRTQFYSDILEGRDSFRALLVDYNNSGRKEAGCSVVDWIELSQWRNLVSILCKLTFP